MNTVTILNVRVTNESKERIQEQLRSYLQGEGSHCIVTPNPEFLVRAQRDEPFRRILNSADMALPDGVGLKFAAAFSGRKLGQRYTGLELTNTLIELSEHNNYSIYLLGGRGDTAQKLRQILTAQHPRLKIVGAEEGFLEKKSAENSGAIVRRINAAQPDILLVAFGSPKQEKWIARHINDLPAVKIAVGVGGVFNYLTGQSAMAPHWMKRAGLEWLWRLLTEPWRWKRIATATIIFPLLVLRKRFSNFFLKPMTPTIRTRLAPSPSGYLHLGTARSALFNYLFTRKNKGKFILRIEDTDEKRSQEQYYQDIISGLHWLGMEWDEGPDIGGPYGPYRQSERGTIYQPYIEKLLEKRSAYFCYCTKEELEEERKKQAAAGQPPLYSKKCRELSAAQQEEKQGQNPHPIIRFRNDYQGAITFTDMVRGPISTDAQLLGDFSIARDRTTPLFNLAVIIDDELMKITHVIRGEDHIANTPKQILLITALDFSIPHYAHLTLILNSDRSKLSKRKNQTSVISYKKMGYLPQALTNFIAFLGWNPKTTQELFTQQELIDQFDLAKINRSGAIFDQKKLDWLNSQYIKKLSIADLKKQALPFLAEKGIKEKNIDAKKLEKILLLEQTRVKTLAEIGDNLDFLFNDDIVYDPSLLPWKKKKMTAEQTRESLQKSWECLEQIHEPEMNAEQLETTFKSFIEQHKLQNGVMLWPLRVALSGQERSPSPFEIIWIIGQGKAKERLKQALEKLQSAGS